MRFSTVGRRHVTGIAAMVFFAGLMAVAPGAAHGDLINPTSNITPDISSFDMVATYDAGSHTLTVTGCPQYYNASSGGSSNYVTAADDYSLAINAILTPSATTPTSATGSVSLYGSVTDGSTGLLLSGTVDGFGIDLHDAEGYALLDISFRVTGGELAGDFGPTAATLLTVYYSADWGDTAFSDLENNFSYNDICNNVADTFSTTTTPEPGTAALLLTMVAGVAASALRQSRKRRS